MGKFDELYVPSGELQGDTGDLPNRGNKTGLNGSISLPGVDETLSYGKIDAKSDDPWNNTPHSDDFNRVSGGGACPAICDATASMGRMSGTGSDAADDNVPDNQFAPDADDK